MVGSRLRRAFAFVSATAVAGCSLLLGDGLSGDDEGGGGTQPVRNDSSTTNGEDALAGDGGTTLDDGSHINDLFDGSARNGCPSANTDPTLAAWYPFEDQGADTILDCSGHGLDGKLLPDGGFARVASRAGAGNAISIGPTAGCFDLGVAPSLTFVGVSFTVTAWINARTYSYADPLGGTDPKPRWFVDRFAGGTVGKGWGLGTDDTAVATGFIEVKSFRNSNDFDEAEAALVQGAWNHVAGVFTQTSVEVYVNGVFAGENTLVMATPADGTAHGWIGCRGGDEPPFDGTLDDVRIYSRALTPAEIAALAK